MLTAFNIIGAAEANDLRNKVNLVDSIIVINQVGDQTYESVNRITERVNELAKALAEVKILVDHSNIGKLSIGARKAGFEVAKNLNYDKMAFFGTSPYMTGLINLLARSVGRQQTIFFAKSKAEAIAWLKK